MFKSLNNFFRLIGFEIKRYKKDDTIRNLQRRLIKKSPIIFDVGANIGQSIDRYLNDYNNPKIHAFEPNNEAFEILKEKYLSHKNIILNNFALGETSEKRKLNCTQKSGNSSFYELNLRTKWIKERSENFNVKVNQYVKEKQITKIKTIDQYIKKNKIKKIDLLKIDTQGFEEKVLLGSKKNLNIVENIQLEIMLDNCYLAETSFYQIEKILHPNNFRILGLAVGKSHIFIANNFGANVFYSKKLIKKRI